MRFQKTNPFLNDWEFQLQMRPIADKLYRQVWGNDIVINRASNSSFPHPDLDRLLAIDVRITKPNGLVQTGQEKFRRPQRNRYYGDLTIEYMQKPNSNETGDWFRFGGQWYFCGIATEDYNGFRPWVIVDWRQLQEKTEQGYIKWRINQNKEHGLSNFACVRMKELPPDVVIDSSYKYHINLGPLFNGYQIKKK